MQRIEFDLPEGKVKELDALMREAGLDSRKELFNNALTIFEWAVRQKKMGKKIAVIDEVNESYCELSMPILDNLAAKKFVN